VLLLNGGSEDNFDEALVVAIITVVSSITLLLNPQSSILKLTIEILFNLYIRGVDIGRILTRPLEFRFKKYATRDKKIMKQTLKESVRNTKST
jgi:hypothetical protein